MRKSRILPKIGVATLSSLLLSGCAGGGLKNALSWIGPDKYESIDATESESTGDRIERSSLLADAAEPANEKPAGLGSRIAAKLPWNRSVEPDPFVDLPVADVEQDRGGPDFTRDELTRVADTRQDRPFSPQDVQESRSEMSPEIDSEADLAAIEGMLAAMERDIRTASRTQDTDTTLDASGNAEPVIRQTSGSQPGSGRTAQLTAAAASSGQALPEVRSTSGDAASDLERLLQGSLAAHDRHPASGDSLDRAIEAATAPVEFDRMLGRPQDTMPRRGQMTSMRDGSRLAAGLTGPSSADAEEFSTEMIAAARWSNAPKDNLAEAASEFDRTLFGDQDAGAWTPGEAFGWSETESPQTAAAHAGDSSAIPEEWWTGSPNDDAVSAQNAVSPDSIVKSDPFHSSPFSLATATRDRGPMGGDSPFGNGTAGSDAPPWAGGAAMGAGLPAGINGLVDAPETPQVAEVVAVDETPELNVSAGPAGFTVRNGLLFIGGVIVVILLFTPSQTFDRKRPN